MKVFKKLACLMGGAAFAVSLLGAAACGETNQPKPEPPKDDSGDVVTEFDKNAEATLTIGVSSENKEDAIAHSLGDSFREKFPNVTVKYELVTGNTVSTISRLHEAGRAPDVFLANSFDMLSLDSKEILFDFSPYIEAETKKGTFSMSDFYEKYFELGQRDFNGAQIMIPRSVDRVVVHYNKKIVKDIEEETGEEILKYMVNGWTWDDFDAVCELLKKSQKYGYASGENFLVDSSYDWEAVFNPIFKAFGTEYFDDKGNLAMDSENTQKALDFFKNWGDKGYIGLSGKAADFINGKGVMFFHSQSISDVEDLLRVNVYPTVSDKADFSQYYDVVSMPVFPDTPYIGAGAAGYCGYYATKQPVLVWEFMKHLLSKEGQNAIADAGAHFVPVRKDMADHTDPANHWGVGYEKFNLSAYTYMSGKTGEDGVAEPDWSCYTDYFIKPGYTRYASSLNSNIAQLVKSYIEGTSYNAAMKAFQAQVTSTLRR